MSYLGDFAKSTPGKPAVVSAATGEHISYAELNEAAVRAGYYATFVNSHFAAEEVAYQITDSNSKLFISTHQLADLAQGVLERIDPSLRRLMIDGTAAGFSSYEDAIAGASA